MVDLKSMIYFFLATLALCISVTLTSTVAETFKAELETEDANKNITMSADSLSYYENSSLIIASGNVEISQSGRILIADRVLYNERTGTVTASGNVTLLQPNGEVVFANSIELSNEMSEGLVKDLRLLIDTQIRFAANSAKLSGGTRTDMKKGVFSPCQLCPDNPKEPPLWQIKAIRIVHDQNSQDVAYYDAWLEVFGIPLIYTPYFEHPDPSVKRRSGFLAPTYSSSSNVGFQLTTPYYWNIAPNEDAIFKPKFTSNEGVVWGGEYRNLSSVGNYTVDGSLAYVSKRNNVGKETGDNELRGHIFSDGQFNLNPIWKYGYELEGASDDTYLNFYRIESKNTLVTHPYIEGIHSRSYASADAYIFQGLDATDNQDTIPIVLPLLNFQHISEPNYVGAFQTVNANILALHRVEGSDSRRLSLEGGWHLPHIDSFGNLFKISTNLRGDAYHVNNVNSLGVSQSVDSRGLTGRIRPELVAEWRLPLTRKSKRVQQLLEPIVQTILSPYGGNPGKIPNEDSQDFEFDATNLFSNNRFTGLDRVEGGPRLNYGLRFGLFGTRGGDAKGIIGQSARLKKDQTFNPGSGLENKLSDYVGNINISPRENFDFAYRFRIAQKNFSARRNEIGVSAGPRAVRFKLNYAMLKDQISETDTTAFANREEVVTNTIFRLTPNWRVGAGTRRDLTGSGGTIDWNGALTYENECLLLTTQLKKNFTRDREIKPEKSLSFKIKLKELG